MTGIKRFEDFEIWKAARERIGYKLKVAGYRLKVGKIDETSFISQPATCNQ